MCFCNGRGITLIALSWVARGSDRILLVSHSSDHARSMSGGKCEVGYEGLNSA